MIIFVFDTQEECNKFTTIYNKYCKTVHYTIIRFVEDKHTVEDLLHDIYIIIANNIGKIDLDDEKKSQNYIITITRNYCLSYLRKQSKIDENFMGDLDFIKDNQDDILSILIDKEKKDKLAIETGKLDEKYRIVIELKYICNLSDDEISKILKIKKKTVQMRIYRAKLMLRKRIGIEYNEK